ENDGEDRETARWNKEGSLSAAERRGPEEVDAARGTVRRTGADPPRGIRSARPVDVRGDQLDLGWLAHRVQPRPWQDLDGGQEPCLSAGIRSHLLSDVAHRAGP